MATTTSTSTGNHSTKTELEKFTLHFELTPRENTRRKQSARTQ